MLRKLLYDIEVYSPITFPLPEKAEHPICSNTFYDNFTETFYSIIIDPSRAGQKKIEGNWQIYYTKDERDLIILSVKLIRFLSPDCISGWYNSSFDDPYFFNRCHNLNMTNVLNSISPLNYVNIRGKSISGMHLIDMIILDKKIKKRTSYTLANVAIEENLGVEKLEKHEDIMEIYRTDKDRFVKYNKGDVEILEKLEKKNRIIDFFENTRTFAGLNSIDEALKNSVIVDTVALRKAFREGIVLPSKPTREESEESEDEDRSGGFVKFPKPKIHRMVAVLDMAKFYPVILGLLNLSTETIVADNLTKSQIDVSTGDYYVEYEPGKYVRINSKVKGFMPSLYEEFLTERLAVEAEMKKYEIGSDEYNFLMQKRQVVKDTSNSLPGVNGYGGFRLHNNVIANAITFTGQKMIKIAESRLEEQKIDVIYMDTDSCHIELPNLNPEELVKRATELSDELSKGYIDVVKKEYNIDTKKSFEIEFEKAFKSILYISKDDGTPAKKRYGARCVVVSEDSNINLERNSHKNIKDIKINDKILAWSEENGIVKTEVKNIFKRETDEYLQIYFDDETNIKVTEEHPLYVIRNGWKEAKDIKEGDILLNSKPHWTEIHKKEKCPICDNEFVQLTNHIRYFHEGLSPSKNKETSEKSKETYKNKISDKKCPICDKLFRNLGSHINMIHKNSNPMHNPEVLKKFQGDNNWMTTLEGRLWAAKRISGDKNPMKNEETYKKARISIEKARSEGRIIIKHSEEGKKSISNAQKLSWSDPENAKKRIQMRFNSPNKLEREAIELFKKYNLPVKFVGNNREYLIKAKSIGRRYLLPDFIVENTNKVIEVRDSNVNYKPEDLNYEIDKTNQYKSIGYECLALVCPKKKSYSKFIEESLPKVLEFLHNGRRVVYIKKIKEKCDVINFECEPYNNYFVNNILVHNCFYEKEKYVDYLYVRGFDIRRSDASNYCKNIQEQVLRLILWDHPKEETIKYVQNMIEGFKKAQLEDISIPKGIQKNIADYGKLNKNNKPGSIPIQIKGAIYSNVNLGTNFGIGSKIKYFYVKRMPTGFPPTNIISFDDINKLPKNIEVDYEKMSDANIKKKIERILAAAEIDWNSIAGQKSLFDF